MREQRRLNRIARRYRVQGDFDAHAVQYGAAVIREHARGQRALEIGCADGAMTRHLAKQFRQLTVVEASPRYVQLARRRLLPRRATFHTRLIEQFTTQERFDAIICAHVLEHVRQPVALLRRLRGWLTPRGHLHLIVPNAGSLHRRLGVAMRRLPRLTSPSPRDRAFGHRRVYDRARLLRDLARARLRADRVEGVLLKPLSNAQMRSWNPRLIRALFAVGRELPEWCNELYARCRRA